MHQWRKEFSCTCTKLQIKTHQVNESDSNQHKCSKRAFGENKRIAIFQSFRRGRKCC